jgi:hypothetical protein
MGVAEGAFESTVQAAFQVRLQIHPKKQLKTKESVS